MSARQIVIWPDSRLSRCSRPVGSEPNDQITALAQDLIDTCETVGALGLAAIQVGEDLRVAVINVGRLTGESSVGYETIIDPVPVWGSCSGDTLECEGCFSLPGEKLNVKRFKRFAIDYTSLDGSKETIAGEGPLSIVLQHVMEMMDGRTIVTGQSPWIITRTRKRLEILKRRMSQSNLSYLDVVRGR